MSAKNPAYLALPPQPIRLSTGLIDAVKAEKNAHDPAQLPYFPRAVVAEAQQAVAVLSEHYLAPPTEEELRDFVKNLYDALNAIVRNPAEDRALSVRSGIACTVLAEVPRVVLTQGFERFCFARCKFLPAPADLLEMAEEYAKPYNEKISRLKLLVTIDQCKRFTQGRRPEETDDEPMADSEAVRHITHATFSAFPSRREEKCHA